MKVILPISFVTPFRIYCLGLAITRRWRFIQGLNESRASGESSALVAVTGFCCDQVHAMTRSHTGPPCGGQHPNFKPQSYTASVIMCKSKPNNALAATLKCSLLLVLLLLSGCAVKFVYNQLDWAVPWYLSDYMSLNSTQEQVFEERLNRYLAWHRKTQLPEYGAFLEQVAEDLEDGMTPPSVQRIQARTRQLGQALIERLVPDMVALFQHASDQQLVELYDKFAEKNKEYTEEYLEVSEKEQRKRRAKDIESYVERWTGGLSSAQEALIRDATDQYALMGGEFLEARLAWQEEFRRVLAMRNDKQAFEKALTRLLLAEDFGRSEEFERKYAHNQKLLESVYLRLDQSLSKKQRAQAVKKLRSYAGDFYELAAQD